MNTKIIKCLGCSLIFAVTANSLISYFRKCEDHLYCEPQEHIELRNFYGSIQPSANPTITSTGASMTFTSTTTLPPIDE